MAAVRHRSFINAIRKPAPPSLSLSLSLQIGPITAALHRFICKCRSIAGITRVERCNCTSMRRLSPFLDAGEGRRERERGRGEVTKGGEGLHTPFASPVLFERPGPTLVRGTWLALSLLCSPWGEWMASSHLSRVNIATERNPNSGQTRG